MHAKALALTAPSPLRAPRAGSTAVLMLAIYFSLCAAVLADCSFGATDSPMGMVLCQVVYFMYGNLGRGLATLAIIVLGVGALLGKTSWGMALTVGVGISVIFNAETIASLLLCGTATGDFC